MSHHEDAEDTSEIFHAIFLWELQKTGLIMSYKERNLAKSVYDYLRKDSGI